GAGEALGSGEAAGDGVTTVEVGRAAPARGVTEGDGGGGVGRDEPLASVVSQRTPAVSAAHTAPPTRAERRAGAADGSGRVARIARLSGWGRPASSTEEPAAACRQQRHSSRWARTVASAEAGSAPRRNPSSHGWRRQHRRRNATLSLLRSHSAQISR